MGTEFQYAINPLATNPKNISFFVGGGLDDWDHLEGPKQNTERSTVFINFKDSMDKILDQEKVESLKRTMMTHEHIFKHQVRELHRLYNIQKILMKEMRNGVKQKTSSLIPTNSGYNIHHIESLTQNPVKMTKGFDLERPIAKSEAVDIKGQLGAQESRFVELSAWGELDVSTGIRAIKGKEEDLSLMQAGPRPKASTYIGMKRNSNICNKDNIGYEESDVDLTLSIGGKKQFKSEGSSSSHQKSDLPHWLYQGLSSNKT